MRELFLWPRASASSRTRQVHNSLTEENIKTASYRDSHDYDFFIFPQTIRGTGKKIKSPLRGRPPATAHQWLIVCDKSPKDCSICISVSRILDRFRGKSKKCFGTIQFARALVRLRLNFFS